MLRNSEAGPQATQAIEAEPPPTRPIEGPLGPQPAPTHVEAGAAAPIEPQPDDSHAATAVRAGIRDCYNRGLRRAPNMPGNVRVSVRVGERGDVASVRVTPDSLPKSVSECMVGRVSAVSFAPRKSGFTMVIPTTESP